MAVKKQKQKVAKAPDSSRSGSGAARTTDQDAKRLLDQAQPEAGITRADTAIEREQPDGVLKPGEGKGDTPASNEAHELLSSNSRIAARVAVNSLPAEEGGLPNDQLVALERASAPEASRPGHGALRTKEQEKEKAGAKRFADGEAPVRDTERIPA